jgi:membrane protein DedA with SNARE-associated domain
MIEEALYGFFKGLGPVGGLIAIFLIFYIDAMILPLLPELFAVFIFTVQPTFEWGLVVIFIAETGTVLGNSTLYFAVKKIGMPRFLRRVMNRYVNFLFLKDERLILSNRIAPVIPFVGAFMAACNWSYKKSVLYIAAGGLVKYSILLTLVGIFHLTVEQATVARTITLIMVVIVIVMSAILAYLKIRKEKKRLAEMGKKEVRTEAGD